MAAKDRVPDLATAIRCLETLSKAYDYHPTEELLFKDDVKHSLKIIKKALYK